jgi:Predicted membrane protein
MLVIDLTTLGMLITNRQQGSAMSFIAWIVLGLIAGFIGSKLVNHTGEGLIRDVLLGVVGAIIGGYLFNVFGAPGVTGLNLYSLLVAVVGAVVFLIVYHALFRRRRFA